MKKNSIYKIGFIVISSVLFTNCDSYYGTTSSGYRSVNPYNHGNMGWGNSYYNGYSGGGGPVIIIDDRPDIPDIPDFGPPEAIQLPEGDW